MNAAADGSSYGYDALYSHLAALNLSGQPSHPPHPAYDEGASSSHGAAGGVGSNIWRCEPLLNGFVDFNSNGDDTINRMRANSAARVYMQPNPNENHLYNNVTGANYNYNINYNNYGRSTLNGFAAGYQPTRTNYSLNEFHNSNANFDLGHGNRQLRYSTRNNNNNSSGFEYMKNRTESNSAPTWISNFRCGYSGSLNRLGMRLDSLSLEELRGKLVSVVMDQYGSQYLQNKLEGIDPNTVEFIFSELKGHICYLMVDQVANQFIQKFFKVCNENQITEFLYLLVTDHVKFKDICCDMHGTRVVQKLLDKLTTPNQVAIALSVLRRITIELTRSMNGQHVIQHCLKSFPPQDNEIILQVIADNCLAIASDRSGCCVLQPCVSSAQGETRNRMIANLTAYALLLSTDPYGNYVVQYMVDMPKVKVQILTQLSGNFVPLSMDKYGSNVVEKCLKGYNGNQLLSILNEIMNSPNFVQLLQDPYGNYVAQSALICSKGAARDALTERIHSNYAFLHSHPHGKRVLERARCCKIYRA
ncbi:hypothetical protein ABFS82_02G040600 [Erythranthe guttata]|uniref:pumilio homolog 12-like n=1 Tax=Erythranthe guttata TaxID=4155 RepID=UPI00064DFCBB|nr:PREDICTED: pumilio homolog 12-like [Erythranthe guttata]|eukprot:XP_012836883.1 PREDICTED: pumilio homolog 12-like [Erythranthe guttata]